MKDGETLVRKKEATSDLSSRDQDNLSMSIRGTGRDLIRQSEGQIEDMK